MSKNLYWLRNDLRLDDNPALINATKENTPTLCCYIFDQTDNDGWGFGGASKWWLHHSLISIKNSIEAIGGSLLILSGDPKRLMPEIVSNHSITGVFWNRRYTKELIEKDASIKTELKNTGIEVTSYNGSLITEPWNVLNKSGKPYQVYTPYWKNISIREIPEPIDAPKSINGIKLKSKGIKVEELNLLPKIKWDTEFYNRWTPGEPSALEKVNSFIPDSYADERNIPSITGTSSLSPHLHFGEVSPRRIWHRHFSNRSYKSTNTYLKELAWRDFAYHLIFNFPQTTNEPLKETFKKFPWRNSKSDLKAWQKGETGYPIVDAGMKELWTTGWMHNRVRMIVGSFLVKHLLLNWQHGADWFWDTLVDADLASNTMGWQWVAGTGADAAPYFRVFNPILQGQKFDPDGIYVKKWLPELKEVPKKFIHKPWELGLLEQSNFGLKLGKSYPKPIVDVKFGRDRALDAYKSIK